MRHDRNRSRLLLTSTLALTISIFGAACAGDATPTASADARPGSADAGAPTPDTSAPTPTPDAGTASDTTAPPTFALIPTTGGTQSAGFGINRHGHVVGWSLKADDTTRHAFVHRAGTSTSLGMLSGDTASTARGINDEGTIAGTSEKNVRAGSGTYHAFTYSAGVMTALPDLGGTESYASGINNAGVVAGYAWQANHAEMAVTWKAGALTKIGHLSGVNRTRATAINDRGLVVGWQYQAASGTPNDAVTYDGTTWKVIGGTGPWQNAEAKGVNAAGVVVGLSAFPSGKWTAAVWQSGKAPTSCGNLKGMDYSELYAINARGDAVGRAYRDDPPQSRAVLCRSGKLIDLNDRAPAGFSGVLWEARDINDRGQLVGTASVKGKFRAFTLTLAD